MTMPVSFDRVRLPQLNQMTLPPYLRITSVVWYSECDTAYSNK